MKKRMGLVGTVMCLALMVFPATAANDYGSTTFDGITFSYSITASLTNVSAYCHYAVTDPDVDLKTTATAYKYLRSNPLSTTSDYAEYSRTANNSIPCQVSMSSGSSYYYYYAKGTYKVSNSDGSLQKSLTLYSVN